MFLFDATMLNLPYTLGMLVLMRQKKKRNIIKNHAIWVTVMIAQIMAIVFGCYKNVSIIY
jgi:hypothetical protein